MSSLLLLLIFWQPVYWFCRYVYLEFIKKNSTSAAIYKTDAGKWFKTLWYLIVPNAGAL